MPVALHAHSWYSLLEGTSSPTALLARATVAGYSALALTDTNNLYGATAFAEEAKRPGARPLLGACLRQGRQHCIALIAERAGYRNLCQIISRLNLAEKGTPLFSDEPGEPPQEKSCVPFFEAVPLADLLVACSEGLHILVDDVALAERLFPAFERRLWLELVRPRPEAPRHEQGLFACAARLNLPVVASTAAHFATPAEYPAFRLVTALRQRAQLDQLPQVLAIAPEHHLPAVEDFRRRFHDVPEAVRNGDALAELLRADVLPRDLVLPAPRLRPGLAPIPYLRALCERGLRERRLGGDLTARQRLREELAIVEGAGLAGYFLTVRDITRSVRRRGHTMALRGSAGNSLVCYLLAITDVDPLRFGLEPERFLHPGRVDLPDVDLDFDWKVRDEIIAGVIARYGPAHVARISSHLFLQPRSAFREAGKAHGLSNEQISGLLTTLSEKVDDVLLPTGDGEWGTENEEWRRGQNRFETRQRCAPSSARSPLPVPDVPPAFPLEPGRWARLVADARRLLGRPHYLSLHPGGIVITPRPVEEYVPLQWAAKGLVMTQFDKDGIEQIGLVKIDLLGNRALSAVDEARRHAGVLVPPGDNAPLDEKTIQLLQRGDTLGITQLESPAMRHLILQMRPRGVEDVIQSLALLRPGAASIGMKERFVRRRHGLEPVDATHPALARVLGETYGLMLYEDDALRLIQGLTGLDAADADRFRKRISKHKTPEEGEVLRQEFLHLCDRRGVPAEALDELWAQLAKFNRYSFCKSHAVSYGLIAWQAAYLKAHHPVAFWVAALNNAQGAYPPRVYVEAIKRAGIEVRPPCVNRSLGPFRVEGQAVRTGLDAIAGLPEVLRQGLLQERDGGGPYHNLADLRRRLRPGPEALASLIRCGAFDFAGRSRPALVLEADLGPCRPEGELFAVDATGGWSPPDDPPLRRYRDEWQLLGFVLGPPLFSLFRRAEESAGPPLVPSHELAAHAGRVVRVRGLVATARHVVTENGRPIQFVTLEDEHGLAEVTLFSGTCAPVPYLTIGPYVATGTVEDRHGAVTLTAQRFER